MNPRLFLLAILTGVCWSQSPYLYSASNSASYSEDAIAQGSIFTVFGYQIGPAQIQKASSFPLPLQIAGTSIQVTVGNTVMSCPMVYAASDQAAAILPSNATPGQAMVNLTRDGKTTPFGIPITIKSSAFGIYTIDSSGRGPGVITGANFKAKGFEASAAPGETVILWGTGLGPIQGEDSGPPPTGTQFANVQVFAGSTPARVVYAGRSGCCAGVDQLAFQLPAAPSGCFVPIAVRSGGIVSNFVTLAVQEAGGTCSDAPPGPPSSVLVRALHGENLSVGAAAIGPIRVLAGAGFQFTNSLALQLSEALHASVSERDTSDLVFAFRARNFKRIQNILHKYNDGQSSLNRPLLRAIGAAISMDQQGAAAAFGLLHGLSDFVPYFASHLVPAGSCIVTGEPLIGYGARTHGMDAGQMLTLSGPTGPRSMTRVRGQYQVSLGSGYQTPNVPLGTYTISGNGGQDILAFRASLHVTSSIVWTNKSAITAVDRTQPLTVRWAGGEVSGHVMIGGSVHAEGANITLVCLEDTAKGSFTIPAFVLSALPAAPSKDAYFFVAPHPLSNPVTIPGLDLAYFADASSDYQAVRIR